jgi:glyoxylase-like metal-dependent hydrolase (beta-lactamase superfamily II)
MTHSYPVDMSQTPDVKAFFDEATWTITYVVKDPASNSCAIVDSVMDIDYAAGRISYESADEVIAYIESEGLTLEWLLETHVHADHLSGAPTFNASLVAKSRLVKTSRLCRMCSAKCSTRAPNSNATARNLIVCSKTVTL